mgnify:CR=1 FL=1
MKLYPYSNIRTENLKGLLIASRALGAVSYILLTITLCFGIYGTVIDSVGSTEIRNGLTLSATNNVGATIMASMWGVVSSVFILAFSGLCAAVVSCEYKYTKTTE